MRLEGPVEQRELARSGDAMIGSSVEMAKKLYTDAINVDPTSELAANIYTNRALCHMHFEDYEEALNDGTSATLICPKWSRGYLRIAEACCVLKRYEEALTAFRKIMKIETDQSSKAYQEAKSGYQEIFKEMYNDSDEAKKRTQEEMKLIGNEFIAQERFLDAVFIFFYAAQRDPKNPAAAAIHSNRSLCHYKLEEYNFALSAGQNAVKLRPDWPRGYFRVAMAASMTGDFQIAHEAFEKYAELDPEGANDEEVAKPRNIAKKKAQELAATTARKKQASLGKRGEFEQLVKKFNGNKDHPQVKQFATNFLRETMVSKFSPSKFSRDDCLLAIEYGAKLESFSETSVELGGRTVERSLLYIGLVNRPTPYPRADKEYEEVLLHMIEETHKRGIDFHPGVLVGACCWDEGNSPILPSPKLLKALLATGKCDPNKADTNGTLPLHVLAGAGLGKAPATIPFEVSHCIQILAKHPGINLNGVNSNAACAIGDFKSDQTMDNLTPLMIACQRSHELAFIFINVGADVCVETFFAEDERKMNALHFALKCSPHPDLIKLLIEKGAKLLENCSEPKTSSGIWQLFVGDYHYAKKTIPVKTVQHFLELSKKQGLRQRYVDSRNGMDLSYIACAILSSGADQEIVATVAAVTDRSVGDPFNDKDTFYGKKYRPLEHAFLTPRTFEHILNCVNVLLHFDADLMLPTTDGLSTLASVLKSPCMRNPQMELLKAVVVQAKGKEYWNKVKQTVKGDFAKKF